MYTHAHTCEHTHTHMNMYAQILITTQTDKYSINGPSISANRFLFMESIRFSSTHHSPKSVLSLMDICFSMTYMIVGIYFVFDLNLISKYGLTAHRGISC